MSNSERPKLIKEGSVKSIFEGDQSDTLLFSFSDRYSIFDWGEMPDLIEGKGDSLLWFSSFFFEFFKDVNCWKEWTPPRQLQNSNVFKKLCSEGLPSHYRGIKENQYLEVEKIKILEPPFVDGEYQYDSYQSKLTDILLPLEVVFRFGLPEGSSFFERADDASYLKELGLDQRPSEDSHWDVPVVEFSTKLESRDRYLTYSEAMTMAGLDQQEWEYLVELNKLVACRLRDCFKRAKLELWDGKFEWGIISPSEQGHREFKLVDSIGPDEIRLVYEQMPLSKELLRQFYRKGQWKKDLDRVKKEAQLMRNPNWKELCLEQGVKPEALSPDQREVALNLYPAIAHQLAKTYGKDCFLTRSELSRVRQKWEELR